MTEDKNKPSSGSLFKSKFKTNDGSEEDNKRESYYGTFRDENGKKYLNTFQPGPLLIQTNFKIWVEMNLKMKCHFDYG